MAQAIVLLGGNAEILDALIADGAVRSARIGAVTYVDERDLFPYIKPTAASDEPDSHGNS